MIKNERQYRITKAQATKLEQALEHLTTGVVGGTQVHPLLHKAQEDALRSQIADLHAEIEEYEALQSQRHTVLELASFEEFPRALIQARIAAGLSQKDLAERLGSRSSRSSGMRRQNTPLRAWPGCQRSFERLGSGCERKSCSPARRSHQRGSLSA